MKKQIFWTVVFGLLSRVSVMAAGSDELWEVSSKMEIAGMPVAMPAQTSKICMPKGHEKDPNNAVPKSKEQDCKISDVKTAGNKTTWKMTCEGKNPMTGDGEMTRGDGSYSGKSVLHSKRREVTTVYSGKRIGSCQAKG